jgi:hypothetical protein
VPLCYHIVTSQRNEPDIAHFALCYRPADRLLVAVARDLADYSKPLISIRCSCLIFQQLISHSSLSGNKRVARWRAELTVCRCLGVGDLFGLFLRERKEKVFFLFSIVNRVRCTRHSPGGGGMASESPSLFQLGPEILLASGLGGRAGRPTHGALRIQFGDGLSRSDGLNHQSHATPFKLHAEIGKAEWHEIHIAQPFLDEGRVHLACVDELASEEHCLIGQRAAQGPQQPACSDYDAVTKVSERQIVDDHSAGRDVLA